MSLNSSIQDTANRRNLRLIVLLRWAAVAGQLATIAIVYYGMGLALPLAPMTAVLWLLIGWNGVALLRLRSARPISRGELFTGLLVDVAALTVQLYLSGGATNPFVSLFLLQVMLGAVLLDMKRATALAGATLAAFVLLIFRHRPLVLPHAHGADFFDLHLQGMFVCFVLTAALLLVFVTRITRNLQERDLRLAELRRQAAEEDHIVRIGLLAAGAAHELGTPLATLSVILNDWRKAPLVRDDPEAASELDVMESELERCKTIVSGILVSSGELRGEGTVHTTARAFLDGLVDEWRAWRAPPALDFVNRIDPDAPMAADVALKQVVVNLLDNALEASPGWIGVEARRDGDRLVVAVRDAGPGFTADMLENFGRPYASTKGRRGGGLGLFLVMNVARKLGGAATAANRPQGGAEVILSLPLSALAPRTAAVAEAAA